MTYIDQVENEDEILVPSLQHLYASYLDVCMRLHASRRPIILDDDMFTDADSVLRTGEN